MYEWKERYEQKKISIRNVDEKKWNCCFKKIVEMKIEQNIEEKEKKAQKANMTEKKPVMRFCTHDIWEKKIESKCCFAVNSL